MAEVKVRQLKKALVRKGFKLENRDHHYYRFFYEGRKSSVRTKISHGEESISDPLIHSMSKQMRLSKNEFVEFVDCKLGETDYISILRSQNILH